MTTCPLSKKTRNWLLKWQWDAGDKSEVEFPSKQITKELSKYRPTNPITVYRGISPEHLHEDVRPRLKSFTYDVEAALAIGQVIPEYRNPGDEPGRLQIRTVKPKDILVDFRRLPKECDDFLDNEVIVMEKQSKNITLKSEQRLTTFHG